MKAVLGQIRDVIIVDENGNQTGTSASPLPISGSFAAVQASYDLFIPEYDANNNPLYICQAVPGSATGDTVWQIYKLSYDSNNNISKKRYADGVSTFIKEADLYATYSYTDI